MDDEYVNYQSTVPKKVGFEEEVHRRYKRDTASSIDRNEIQLVYDYVESGKTRMKNDTRYEDVVLVLGNTGAGKSTLVQLLAGNNTNLISKKKCHVFENKNHCNDDFKIIDTNKKIGSNVIYSHTEIPERVFDSNTNTVFYDCPGFNDNRDAKHDIGGTYFIKKVTDNAKAVKFVFVVNYAAVTGMDKENFMQLAKHATNMIQNITKFKDSIAMVATKVNDHKKTDKEIISTITNYLELVYLVLGNRKTSRTTDKKIMQFVGILLTVDDNNDYSRIGFFRQPKKSGPLSNIIEVQENKKLISNILHNNIKYIKHDDANDFDYIISDKSKMYVNDLIGQINENIAVDAENIANNLTEYYNNLTEKMINKIDSFITDNDEIIVSDSDYSFITELDTAFNTIFILVKEMNNATTPNEFLNKITHSIDILNIPISNISDSTFDILTQAQYLEFFRDVAKFTTSLKRKELQSCFQGLIITLDHLKRSFYTSADKIAHQIENVMISNIEDSEIKIQNYFSKKEETVGNITVLYNIIKFEYNKLLEIYNTAKNLEENNDCIKRINDFVININTTDTNIISASQILSKNIKYGNYLKNIQIMNNQPSNLVKCAEKLYNVNKYLQNSEKWYKFLCNLVDRLLKDNMIQNIQQHFITDLVIRKNDTIVKATDLRKKFKKLFQDNNLYYSEFKSIEDITLDKLKIDNLNLLSQRLLNHYMKHYNASLQNNLQNNNQSFSIDDLYDTSVFVNELYSLEKQFYKLHKKISFLPFYESLLERIDHYVARIKNNTAYEDNFKVLKYLRAATWSKIHNINYNQETYLVIDVNGYFTLIKEHIQQYNKALKEVKINKLNDNYRATTKSLINEAKDFIEQDILPGINKILKETDEKIDSLVKEVISLKNDTINEKKKIVEARDKLEGQLFGRAVLGVIQVASAAAAFAGPIGAAAGALVGSSALIVQTEWLDNTSEFGQDKITALPPVIRYSVNKITDALKNKQNAFKQNLVDADKFLDDFCLKHSSDELLRLKGQISNVKDDLDKIAQSGGIPDLESQKRLKNLKKELKESVELLQRKAKQEKLDANNPERSEINIELSELQQKRREEMNRNFPVPYNQLNELNTRIATLLESSMDNTVKNANELATKISALDFEIKTETAIRNSLKSATQEQVKKHEENLEILNVKRKQLLDNEKSLSDIKTINLDISNKEKQMVEEMKKAGNLGALNRTKELYDEIVKLSNNKTIILKKQKEKNDVKIQKKLDTLNHVQNAVSMIDVSYDALNRYRNHKGKIANHNIQIEIANDKIEKLENYEEGIYAIIIPLAHLMNDLAKNISENSPSQSHAAIDKTAWEIQSKIKDVKFRIEEMTAGFQAQDNIKHCFEKFQYGMETLIKMYDRIAEAKEKQNLVDYIADINSDVKSTDDTELNHDIDNLEKIIKSNIVLQEYNEIMNAFKQYIFPFADEYLSQIDLNYTYDNKTQDLMDTVIQNINSFNDTIVHKKFLRNENLKNSIHREVIFGDEKLGIKPFFVWKYDNYKTEILKLLRGEEIIIYANIAKGRNLNAIKFQHIGVNFKLLNTTLQSQFDAVVEPFMMEMTHLGESHYKCGNNTYIINHPQKTFRHKSIMLDNGMFTNPDDSYLEIKYSLPILSPYTMWKIKLTINDGDHEGESTFDKLIEYSNQLMDLELVGTGYYVRLTADICKNSNNLEKYYKKQI